MIFGIWMVLIVIFIIILLIICFIVQKKNKQSFTQSQGMCNKLFINYPFLFLIERAIVHYQQANSNKYV